DFRPNAPNHLQRIVRRCLAKDREDRYQTIKDVAIELRDLRRELEGATVPPMRSETTADPGAEITTVERGDAQTGSAASSISAPTSSAEYIVTGIKQHKIAAVITLLVLIVGSVGL